jgi:hypothetical protein
MGQPSNLSLLLSQRMKSLAEVCYGRRLPETAAIAAVMLGSSCSGLLGRNTTAGVRRFGIFEVMRRTACTDFKVIDILLILA